MRSTKPQPYQGFLLKFEPRRTEKIRRDLDGYGEASESFSAMDWDFEPREVVLLSLDDEHVALSGAALMERMHGSGGTGRLMMRLSEPILFEHAIHQGELLDELSLEREVSTSYEPKRLTEEMWQKSLSAIQRLRSEWASALDELLAKRLERHKLLGQGPRTERLVEQRDAVGTALDIAGLDRKNILRSLNIGNQSSASSILHLLDSEPWHEQDALQHDALVFRDLLTPDMARARFTDGPAREVRVYVYDKKPLETLTGIDLLIYQSDYGSLLLMQYKMMDKIFAKQGSTWSYLRNKQLDKQIAAMDSVVACMPKRQEEEPDIMNWRLCNDAFYFKFCESTRPNARDDALVRGLTLSLRHLKEFLTLPQSDGPNGGKRIGYDNCPRYLSTSEFVQLARQGWIGCDTQGLEVMKKVLEAQRNERAVMLASIRGSAPKHAGDRGAPLRRRARQ